MREPLPKRDQREIVVPARGTRTAPLRRSPSAAASRRPASGWFTAAGSAIGGIGRLCLRRPGEVIGSVVALGAVTAVAMNALGYQGGPHPAPIFPTLGKTAPGKTTTDKTPPRAEGDKPHAARPADAVKVAEVSPRRIDVPKAEPVPETKPTAEPAQPVAAKPVAAASVTKRDIIAEIIKAGETTASVTPKPDAAVAQAQRALVKLGYGPLTADGVLGPGTRSAIEKFERDRKLPVKGVAAGRTLRELAASSSSTKG